MADRSVGAWDELHESEASQALVFCFDNASPRKVLLRRRSGVFLFAMPTSCCVLNATRSDRSVPPFASQGKSGSMQFAETIERSSRSPWELRFVRYILG